MTPLTADEVLTPGALRFIRRKARQLARRPGFTKSDHEDLAQELTIKVLRALPKFDPKRGTIQAFVKTVVERHAATLATNRKAECRDPENHESLHRLTTDEFGVACELGDTLPEDARRHRLGASDLPADEQHDLALDIGALLDRLPEDLRDLAERLKYQSIAGIAKETGIPRTTLNDARRRLAEIFDEAGLGTYLTPVD